MVSISQSNYQALPILFTQAEYDQLSDADRGKIENYRIIPEKYDPQPSRVTTYFARKRRTWLYGKVARWIPISIKAGQVGARVIQSRAFHNLLQVFTGHPGSPENSWMEHPKLLKTVGTARVSAGVIAGITAIYTLIEQGIEISDEVKKGRMREGIDACLHFVEALSDLADSIAVSASGLNMAGLVQASQVLWVTPLAVTAAFVSMVSVVLNVRGIQQSREIRRKLDQSLGDCNNPGNSDNPIDLRWLSDAISNEEKGDGAFYVRRHFEVINREKYAAQIKYISEEQPEHIKLQMIQALKGRLSNKIRSHKLSILSAVVGLVGVCLIFFVAPLATWAIATGLSIVGLSGFISLLKYISDKKSIFRLESRLDQLCNFDNIPQEWLEKHAKFALDVKALRKKEPLDETELCAMDRAPEPSEEFIEERSSEEVDFEQEENSIQDDDKFHTESLTGL